MAPNDEAGWVQGDFDIPAPTASGEGSFRSSDTNAAGNKIGSSFRDAANDMKELHSTFTRFIADVRKAAADPSLTKMFGGLAGMSNNITGGAQHDKLGVSRGLGQTATDWKDRIKSSVSEMQQSVVSQRDARQARRDEAGSPKLGLQQGPRTPNGGAGSGGGLGVGGRMAAGYFAASQLAGVGSGYVGRVENASLNTGRWTNRMQGLGYQSGMSVGAAETRMANVYQQAGGYMAGPGGMSTEDRLAMGNAMFSMGGGGAYGGGDNLVRQIAGMTRANPTIGAAGAAQLLQSGARGTVSSLNQLAALGVINSREDINDRERFVTKTLDFAMGGQGITRERLSSMVDPTSRINTNLRSLGFQQEEIVNMSYEAAEHRGFRSADKTIEQTEKDMTRGATAEAASGDTAREMKGLREGIAAWGKELLANTEWLQKLVSAMSGLSTPLAILAGGFGGKLLGKLKGWFGGGKTEKPGFLSRAGGWSGRVGGWAGRVGGRAASSRAGQWLAKSSGRVAGATAWAATSAANALHSPLDDAGLTLDLGEHLGEDNLLTKAVSGIGGVAQWFGLGSPGDGVGDPDGGVQDSGLRQGMRGRIEDARGLLQKRTHHSADHVKGLKPGFATALAAMFAENPNLRLNSGFRSVARQKQLWNEALKKYGSEAAARQHVAPPGRSRHNFGLAADIGPKSEYGWLKANAHRFGLHIPLGNEPWHLEPKGSRSGKEMVDMAIHHSAEKGVAMEGVSAQRSSGLASIFTGMGWGDSEKSALARFFGGGMFGSSASPSGGSVPSGMTGEAFTGEQTEGGAMSMMDIARVARSAGFKGAEVAKAVAIAMAESRGNPNAIGDNTPAHLGKYAHLHEPGEQSTGLWQIHYRPSRDKGNPSRDPNANTNPAVNARNAYAIYQQQGWKAWSVTHDDAGSNHYSNWMKQARSAVVGAGVGDPPEPVAGGLPAQSAGGRMVVNGGSSSKTVNMYVTVKDGDGRKLAKEVLRVLRDEEAFTAMGGT